MATRPTKPRIKYNAGNDNHFGLEQIFTDQVEVTESNIKDIINNSFATYEQNAEQITELKQIFKGEQAILQRKNHKSEINEKININILPAIINTVAGLWLGEKIDYVYNGNAEDTNKIEDVGTLTKYMRYANDILCDKNSLVEMLIAGVAYQHTGAGKGNKKVKINKIPSESCFTIHSKEIGYPVLLNCIYSKTNNNIKITAYSDTTKYVLTQDGTTAEYKVASSLHLLPQNPIQQLKLNEYYLSMLSQLEACQNAFNLAISDSINGTIAQIQSLLYVLNAEIDKDDLELVKEKGILSATSKDGKQISLGYVQKTLDENIVQLRQDIMEYAIFIAGLPSTGGGTSGNTGAVLFGSGYYTANQNAYFNELEFKEPKQNIIDNVLEILRIDNIIKTDLSSFDIEIRFDRNKLTSVLDNANALAILIGTGAPVKDSIKVTGLFNDIDRVAKDMEQRIKEIAMTKVASTNNNSGGNDGTD